MGTFRVVLRVGISVSLPRIRAWGRGRRSGRGKKNLSTGLCRMSRSGRTRGRKRCASPESSASGFCPARFLEQQVRLLSVSYHIERYRGYAGLVGQACSRADYGRSSLSSLPVRPDDQKTPRTRRLIPLRREPKISSMVQPGLFRPGKIVERTPVFLR